MYILLTTLLSNTTIITHDILLWERFFVEAFCGVKQRKSRWRMRSMCLYVWLSAANVRQLASVKNLPPGRLNVWPATTMARSDFAFNILAVDWRRSRHSKRISTHGTSSKYDTLTQLNVGRFVKFFFINFVYRCQEWGLHVSVELIHIILFYHKILLLYYALYLARPTQPPY